MELQMILSHQVDRCQPERHRSYSIYPMNTITSTMNKKNNLLAIRLQRHHCIKNSLNKKKKEIHDKEEGGLTRKKS